MSKIYELIAISILVSPDFDQLIHSILSLRYYFNFPFFHFYPHPCAAFVFPFTMQCLPKPQYINILSWKSNTNQL